MTPLNIPRSAGPLRVPQCHSVIYNLVRSESSQTFSRKELHHLVNVFFCTWTRSCCSTWMRSCSYLAALSLISGLSSESGEADARSVSGDVARYISCYVGHCEQSLILRTCRPSLLESFMRCHVIQYVHQFSPSTCIKKAKKLYTNRYDFTALHGKYCLPVTVFYF